MNKPETARETPSTLARPASRPRRSHPLGPLAIRVPAADPRAARWGAAGLLGCAVVALALAIYLHPDPHGHSTHTQLGLPECGLMRTFNIPCPNCGMTTAFAYGVRGQWLRACDAQPAGFLVFIGTIAAIPLAFSVLFTGKVWRINWYRIKPSRAIAVAVVLLLAAWAYKIARVLADNAGPPHG